MRPQAGWGTVAELMDTGYQARALYGGPDGPNYPSPRALLDIPGWQQMDKGEAAQAVEVSAVPGPGTRTMSRGRSYHSRRAHPSWRWRWQRGPWGC